MKKILVKAYLAKNFGDDLFLKILFEKYKGSNFILDTTNNEYKEIFSNYNNVYIIKSIFYKLLKLLKLEGVYYKKFDAIVFIGGSIFIQLDIWKEQYEYRKKLFKIFNNKPKFILGSNFGPFKDKKFLESYKELLINCTDICFREQYSFNLFKELNNIRVAPDIVFQLKPKNIKKKKNTVGISLIDLNGRKDLNQYNHVYNKKIKELVEYFIDNNKTITFFSFCESEGDINAINSILSIIDNKYKEKINVENYTGNIDEFLSKFESMENIIGTRFHACILSQVFGQGLYPLIYSDKTYNVLKDINLDNEYLYINNIDKIDHKHILKVIDNNKIKNTDIFTESEKQFEGLDNYIYGEYK